MANEMCPNFRKIRILLYLRQVIVDHKYMCKYITNTCTSKNSQEYLNKQLRIILINLNVNINEYR